MRTRILAATTLATALLSGWAFAQTPQTGEDHSAHHPAGAAQPPVAPAPASGAAPTPQAIEQQMKAMQAMHQKMQSAKRPAERAQLLDEHMQLMQSGMAMMGQMRSGAASMGGMGKMPSDAPGGASQPRMHGMDGMMDRHLQMERRMAMMEQMLQMMVDREAARAGQ